MSEHGSNAREVAEEILGDCLAGRVRKLARIVDRVYNQRLRELGLRNTQLTLLAMLGYMGEAQAAVLGRQLAMDPSSLSRTLARMEDSGWLQTGGDGRIRLTGRGERLLVESRRVWREAQTAAARELGASRCSSLGALLDDFASESTDTP